MRRRVWMWGVVAGVLCGVVAHAAERHRLEDVRVTATNNEPFTIPSVYGHLVSVVVKSEIHYLYFEDNTGTIRVVLLGPRGSGQKARNDFQLLTPEVFLIQRGEGDVFAIPGS